MKKSIISIIMGISLTFFTIELPAEEIKVTGKTIEIIDANIDTDIQQGNRGTRVPSVFRFCIDGQELLVVRSGDAAICLQVIDRDGKPKECGSSD